MACAHFSRCEQARFWVITHSAKAAGDFGKSQIEMAFDVFGEDGGWPHFADDPFDLGPEVPGIVLAAPPSGKAERLARITGSEDMNAVAPRSAVEGSQIVPDRRAIHGLVFHPGHESGRSVGFPLDETHSSIVGLCDGEPEFEPAVSCAERKAAQFAAGAAGGTNNHNVNLRRRLFGRSEEGSQASTG